VAGVGHGALIHRVTTRTRRQIAAQPGAQPDVSPVALRAVRGPPVSWYVGRQASAIPASAPPQTVNPPPNRLPWIRPTDSRTEQRTRNTRLVNHLVGACEQRFGNCDAERVGSFRVHDELKPRRLFDRQIRWLGAA